MKPLSYERLYSGRDKKIVLTVCFVILFYQIQSRFLQIMTKEKNIPVFEVQNLSKSFGQKQVLDIDSIVMDRGKIYCLYGANGSGKTTLFEILMNIQKPDAGRVLFKGREIFPGQAGHDELRQTATLIQQNPLLFDTTVEKNVDYGLRLRKVSAAKRKNRVKACLDFVDLNGFQKQKARRLSGGEAQRVAIARALAVDPEVIFLDEFSANIDSRHREMVEKIIREINRNFGTTIIFTTHYLDQACRLSNHVLHLYQGKIVKTEVRNLFHGEIRKQKDEKVFSNEKVSIVLDGAKAGPANILVPVTAITLSKEPLVSSMRNCFCGKVREIVDQEDLIFLKILAGELFEASITRSAFQELGLGPGSEVYINFKATSVEVL